MPTLTPGQPGYRLPNPPAPEPGDGAGLWTILVFVKKTVAWLVLAALTIVYGQEAHMSITDEQATALQQGMTDLKTTFAELADRVAFQIQQLVDANARSGNAADPRVQSVITDILDTKNQMVAVVGNLRADDSVPPPANNPVTPTSPDPNVPDPGV
jgi:hypothetical protein